MDSSFAPTLLFSSLEESTKTIAPDESRFCGLGPAAAIITPVPIVASEVTRCMAKTETQRIEARLKLRLANLRLF